MSDCISSFSKIIEGLYITGFETACDKKTLDKFHIKAIISLGDIREYCKYDDISYMNIDIYDDKDEDIQKYFEATHGFINDAKGNILVHCRAGISRSVTIVIAYLVSEFDMTVQEALQHIRKIRPCAHPNSGFMKQLIAYQKSFEG